MRITSSNGKGDARVIHADLSSRDVDAIRDGLETMRTAQDGDKVPEDMKTLVDFLDYAKDASVMSLNGVEYTDSGDDDEDAHLSDSFRDGARAAWERSRSLYVQSQRAYFHEQYAPEINARDASFWRFPYTDLSFAILAYEQSRFGRIADREAEELVDPKTWKLFKGAWGNVHGDFDKVFSEVASGGFFDDNGSTPLEVDAKAGTIDITPVVEALLGNGLDLIDIFGDYDPPLGHEDGSKWVITVKTGDKADSPTSYYLECDSYDKDPNRDYEEEGEEPATLETVEFNVDDVIEDYFGFWYLFLYALARFLNCRKSIRALLHPTKRTGRRRGTSTKTLRLPNDPVTKALMQRGKQEILPQQYFGDLSRDIPIATGKGQKAKLTIIVGGQVDFDDLVETYRLGPVDEFWYEAIASLAWDGQAVIRGSDMMKLRGWRNPYQESARSVMEQALRSVSKMNSLKVIVDTTDERRKSYKNLAESYGSRAIVDGAIDIMRFDDGTHDFELKLNALIDGTPFGALPLAAYARDKRQIISAGKEEMEFETVKHLTLDSRMMWSYVMKRLREEKTNNTIVFDTIFRNIGLGDADRFKRRNMLNVLERMLDERQAQGLLTYVWKADEGKVIVTTTDKFKRMNELQGDVARKAIETGKRKPSTSRRKRK